jgi:hypothetical protein
MSDVSDTVSEFATRWELVVDLFETLSRLQLNISIAEVPEDADVVQEYLAGQGINLRDEHQCYVFVMGMCNLVEAMHTSFEAGNVPRDELISALARLLGILAHIRQFLPQEIFTRFLM